MYFSGSLCLFDVIAQKLVLVKTDQFRLFHLKLFGTLLPFEGQEIYIFLNRESPYSPVAVISSTFTEKYQIYSSVSGHVSALRYNIKKSLRILIFIVVNFIILFFFCEYHFVIKSEIQLLKFQPSLY